MFLTDFADAAVTLPLALLVAAFLAVRSRGRALLAWVAAVAATFAAILVLKAAFGFFPALGAAIGVTSPSGHTAASATIYGGLVLVLSRSRIAGIAAALVVAVAIAVSRLALDVHTVGEVVIGGAVGVGGMLLLVRLWPAPAQAVPLAGRLDRLALLALAMVVVAVRHGRHAPFELMLQGLELRATAGQDPF